MIQKVHKYLILFLLAFFFATTVFAEGGNKQGSSLQKVNFEKHPTATLFNVNNISTWIYNNGDSDLHTSGDSGFEYPKGSGNTAVFETGFMWGGKVGPDEEVRVGGSAYRHGLQGGAVLPNGTAEESTESRIFRVRRDWETCDLTNDLAKLAYTESDLRQIYEDDWNDWPAEKGAPYEDVNGDGSYDPAVDVPGVPGADQTIWFVANDLEPALTTNLYGSLPFGVEMQATFWGYNSTGALGNVMFRKYMLINKTDVTGDNYDFKDMYVSIWSDVDLGGSGDDFAGVDTDLSLAFCYNGTATDEQYGAYSPAVGFDFFQGPMIKAEASDTAIFDLKKRGGYKNMPATAHYFFIQGDATYDDPDQGEYSGTREFYNLFRGRVGSTGEKFAGPPPFDDTTSFALWGDPVAGTGWIDGMLHQAGDRRSGMASGPFSMAPGDTQDIVVAELAAGGFDPVDRIGAVGLLKFYDAAAQGAYDNLFKVAKAPSAPNVSVSELDNEIILSWYQDIDKVDEIEGYSNLGYNFEGYCVYQYPYKGASSSEVKLIATFDKDNGIGKVYDQEFDAMDGAVYSKIAKFGSDSGIKNYISITTDATNSGSPLLNGSEYYFAVTAYAVHEDPNNIPRVLESALQSIAVMPQSTGNGVRLESEAGDEVTVDHEGNSDGTVTVTVIDPAAVTGIPYKITFEVETDTNSVNDGQTVWNMSDEDGNVIFSKMAQHTPGSDEHVLYKGLKIQVAGPATGINTDKIGTGFDEIYSPATSAAYLQGWDIAGTFWLWGDEEWNGPAFFGGLHNSFEWWNGLDKGTDFFDVDLKFAGLGDDFPEGNVTAEELRDLSMAKDPDRWSKAAVYQRQDEIDGHYGYKGMGDIPIAAYNAETGERLNLCFVENDVVDDTGKVLGNRNMLWDLAWDQEHGHRTILDSREYMFIMNTPYSPDKEIYNDENYGVFQSLYVLHATQRGSHPYLESEWEVNIFASNVNVPDVDVFTIHTPGVSYTEEDAIADVEEINVFPNPYYGVNPQELNKYNRWVTFTHLPTKAEITIVNLGGQIVRKLNKEDETQFMKWDLANENGLPVASGLYIAYVDLPDLGETKILKVAIFQEQQVLDRF